MSEGHASCVYGGFTIPRGAYVLLFHEVALAFILFGIV
jgi:hypothetical protein